MTSPSDLRSSDTYDWSVWRALSGGCLAPDAVDQPIDRHRGVRLREEQGERRAAASGPPSGPLRCRTADPPASHRRDDPQRPEHLEAHGAIVGNRRAGAGTVARSRTRSSEHARASRRAIGSRVGSGPAAPCGTGLGLRSAPEPALRAASRRRSGSQPRRPERGRAEETHMSEANDRPEARSGTRRLVAVAAGATLGVTGAFAVARRPGRRPRSGLPAQRSRPAAGRAGRPASSRRSARTCSPRAPAPPTTTTCAWRPSGPAGWRTSTRRGAEPTCRSGEGAGGGDDGVGGALGGQLGALGHAGHPGDRPGMAEDVAGDGRRRSACRPGC